jgi:outer membrane protein
LPTPIAYRSAFGRFVFFFNILLFSIVCPTAGWSTDWVALVQQSVKTDPRVLSAQSMVRSRDADVDGSYSAFFPVLRGIGSIGYVGNQDPLVRQGNKQVVGVELEQPIPIFGREFAKVDLAKTTFRIEEIELRRISQLVFGETVEAILGMKASQAKAALRREIEMITNQASHAIEEAVNGGGAKLTDLKVAKSRAAQSRALRAQAEADLQGAQARMERLSPGFKPGILEGQPDVFAQMGISSQMTLDEALAKANKFSPSLHKAQAELAQAEGEKSLAKSEIWPRLTINGQYQTGTFGDASAQAQSIVLGVNAPFFEGGVSVARLNSAGFRLVAAKEKLGQESRFLTQRVTEAWTRWQSLVSICQTWEESEHQEAEAIRSVADQLAAGASTVIAQHRATQTWLETCIQGVDYQYQRDVALIRLLQELGGLELGSINLQ